MQRVAKTRAGGAKPRFVGQLDTALPTLVAMPSTLQLGAKGCRMTAGGRGAGLWVCEGAVGLKCSPN